VIYLGENDISTISKNQYDSGYVNSHLINVVPVVKDIPNFGKILKTPHFSAASSSSKTVLVIPNQPSISNYYFAYDLLSLAYYNYTTALLSDISSLQQAETVVVPNEITALKVLQHKRDYNLRFDNLIIFNLDGYGDMVNIGNSRDELIIDEASEGWRSRGIGSGSIGSPILSNDTNIMVAGKHSLSIDVGTGVYNRWQIAKFFVEPINVSRYDFVKFDWYGRGNEKWYELRFLSDTNSSFSYKFQDSWNGWRPVILPMKIDDNSESVSESFGTSFIKTSSPLALWKKISRIELQPTQENTNHRGKLYFDGFAFVSGNVSNTSMVKDTANKRQIFIPENLGLLPVMPREDFSVAAYYQTDGTAKIPFLLSRLEGGLHLDYFNVWPLIQEILGGKRQNYDVLGDVLSFSNAPLVKNHSIKPRDAIGNLMSNDISAYNTAILTGDVSLNSRSAIVEIDNQDINLYSEGKKYLLRNVTAISPINTGNVKIEGTSFDINEGYGFYSVVTSNKSKIYIEGKPASIVLTFENGTTTNSYIKGERLMLDLQKSEVAMRTPTVSVNGTSYFSKFYGYGEINSRVRTQDQPIIINGTTNFNNQFSDVFTVAFGTSLKDAELIHQNPVYRYDEIGNLSKILTLPYITRYVLTAALAILLYEYYISKKLGKRGSPDK
jgi:hypothetical protein